MERKLLNYNRDKTFIRLLNKDGKSKGIYIINRGDKNYLEQLKEYAIKNELDILYYPNIISLPKWKYDSYYRGEEIAVSTREVYRMDTLFIDIDMSYNDNYYLIRKVLKDSGINNYQVYESASGNIHLYIKVSRFNDTRDYQILVKTIGKYLESKGIAIDDASVNPIQKTYLEDFRILKKNGLKSTYKKELSHRGKYQTKLDILREMKARGIGIQNKVVIKVKGKKDRYRMIKEYRLKDAMKIIKGELQYNYSGELHLTQLEDKYLIPKYTFSRVLGALQGFKAIDYSTIKGTSGYIQVTYYNEDRFNECIAQQKTRKENYLEIIILGIIRLLRNIYLFVISECCIYIEKSIGSFNNFITRITSGSYVQGLLSGNSGIESNQNQLQKIQNQQIQQGERNQTLYKALVKAKYQGASELELQKLASDIHSRMVQSASKPFRKSEVESVLRWVFKITLYNRI